VNDLSEPLQHWYPRARLQRWRPRFVPFAPLVAAVPPQARVLDLGCGAGLFLALLAQRGDLVEGLGVDASRGAIDRAEDMRSRHRHGAVFAFCCQDARTPLPTGPWDVVSLIDVLHHVPPAQQAGVVAAAAKVLRPGGLLIIKEMATTPWWCAGANRLHDLLLAREWIHQMDASTVARWCSSAGLAITTHGAARHAWYAHHWTVAQRTQ